MSVEPAVYSIDQASVYLGIPPKAVRRAFNEHKLAGIRVGHVVAFQKEDLDSFLESCKVPASCQPQP